MLQEQNQRQENTFPTLGVRLSKQMSHEWRSVVVSFVIKDGLWCGRQVQLPTVRFAAIIWICHGASFDRRSVRLFFHQNALWLATADPQKRSHSSSIVPDHKRKNSIQASIHRASHSTACCAFCGEFCFIRWSDEQNPLTSSGPNRLLFTIIRQKPTGKMKQWLSTMKIEWCTFRVQLVCTLVTYVSLLRASAPLSPSSSPGTQTSVLNWW